MTNKLQKALVTQKKSSAPKEQQIFGSMGVFLNGSKQVEVPNRKSFVYIRLRNNSNEVIQAFNNKVSPSYDLPVIMQWENNRYIVLGVDSARYQNNWTSYAPYLPLHGPTHSFSDPFGGDITWIYSRQFIPLLAMPSGSSGAGELIIGASVYRNPSDGSFVYIGDQGTSNFLVAKPNDNQARMMLLYWDLNTATSGIITGSLFSASLTGTSAVIPYVPYLNDNSKIPLAGVRLVSGTASLTWDNIYDVRQFAVNTPSPFSGGFGIWDEGVPQGTGTILNFVGNNIDASISGSVVRIFVTGSSGGAVNPPITGSMVIQDEGITQGSALVLDFVGNNVNVSISGSVARVFVTGSTGGGGSSYDNFWTSGSAGVNSIVSKFSGNDATGNYALAEGNGNVSSGLASHSEGQGNLASGTASHVEGAGNTSYGQYSHAEGTGNKAVGISSHVGGSGGNIVSGTASAILGGAGNILNGSNSSIIAGAGITGNRDNTGYTDYMNVQHLDSGTVISNIGIDSNGFLVTGSTIPMASSNTNSILEYTGVSTSSFTATIATLPGGSNLTYTPTGGNENILNPISSSQLAKMRLYNTTRGNYALILSNNAGTNTTTLTAAVPGTWQVGDTITTVSPTTTGGVAFADFEITSGEFLYKTLGFIYIYFNDSTSVASNERIIIHPLAAFSAAKGQVGFCQVVGKNQIMATILQITNNVFSVAWIFSGATGTIGIRQIAVIQ